MRDPFVWIARYYDRLFHRQDPGPLEELLGLAPGARLLDLGGGTGRVAQDLHEARVIVCDISAAMLEGARQKGLTACQGRAEALPFRDEELAAVLVVDAFHHMDDHPLAVREVLRVVRPGGRVVLIEPDIRRFSMRLVRLGEHALGMDSRFFTLEELVGLFCGAGGSVLRAGTWPGAGIYLVVTRQ